MAFNKFCHLIKWSHWNAIHLGGFADADPSRPGLVSGQQIHWPFTDLAILWIRTIKKTFKSLELWFCDQIWIRRWKNKYNNFIFHRWKIGKHFIPDIDVKKKNPVTSSHWKFLMKKGKFYCSLKKRTFCMFFRDSGDTRKGKFKWGRLVIL